MATRVGEMLVLSMLLVLSGAARAQTTTTDCSSVLVSLSSCLSFVSGSATVPPPACCTALKPVIANSAVCLCRLLGYGSDDSTTVPSAFNQTLAKELPGLCELSANEEKCPSLVGETPTTPAAGGPAPPPTAGSEGPGSSAATSVLHVATILSCAVLAFSVSLL